MAKLIKPKPPGSIAGVHVEVQGEPMLLNGQTWFTLMPTGEGEDTRLWEWSETTGRIIQTME